MVPSSWGRIHENQRVTGLVTRELRKSGYGCANLSTLEEKAFADWRQVRGSLPADVFLSGLLVCRHMHG